MPAWVVVFGVALVVRLIHVWQMRGTVFFSALMGDARGYDAWAERIAAGEWIGREVFYQAPLYPYFLAALHAAGGHDLLFVRVVQAVLGATACVALAGAVTWLLSSRAGVLSGLMLALYPPAIFFDGLIQKSVLDVLFVCLALAAAARIASAGDTRGRWIALGAALGALTLTRENAIVLAVVIAVWAWRRPPLRNVGLLLAGIGLVLLPVVARNYAVGGGVYLTTSQFGSNFYIGNNPRADGSYMSLREGRGSPEYERVDATELAQEAAGRALTPAEVSRYWTARTLEYIQSQPADWLALMARKARLLVSRTEVIDTESQESHAEYSWVLATLTWLWHFGVLLPLAALGALLLWPQRARFAPFYALALAYAASVLAFYVVARYRLPLVPLLIPFAAAGLLGLRRARGVALVTLALTAVLANWPTHTAASQQAITENNLGTALQDAGRTDDAIAHYRRALDLLPGYSPAMNNLGTALRAQGRVEDALATYDAAIAAGAGDNASLHLNRGNALMQQGRVSEAVTAFRQAAAMDAQSPLARRALTNALYDLGTGALATGAFAQAEAALREALSLAPDSAEAHNNLGIALASQGRLREAMAEWEAALRIRPDFLDAQRNLALARQAR